MIKLYLKVIDRWIQDGTDAPAFLKLIEQDCYALGEHHKKAQDFIIQAGKKEIHRGLYYFVIYKIPIK